MALIHVISVWDRLVVIDVMYMIICRCKFAPDDFCAITLFNYKKTGIYSKSVHPKKMGQMVNRKLSYTSCILYSLLVRRQGYLIYGDKNLEAKAAPRR